MQLANINDLQRAIDSKIENETIVLMQDYNADILSNKIIFGWKKCNKLIEFNKENLTLDGNNRRIVFKIDNNLNGDTALFEIPPKAKFTHIKNLNIEIEYNGIASDRSIYAFHNLAKNFKLENCHIKMTCNNQIKMTAFMNEANIDTTLESGADELNIVGCYFNMQSRAISYDNIQNLYGIYNNLGNSAFISSNYLFIQNRGNGERQQAIGVYNSGRYARISDNNIKANGSHNIGKQLENCYATGLINHGEYMLLSDNNIVGEWGGQCLGLVNHGGFAKIDGNKILSTHSIKGRTIRQYGQNGVIANNIIISTSRNPRLVEIYSDSNIIQNNHIEALLRNECYSGCGVYATGKEQNKLKRISILGNQICGTVDCGIMLKNMSGCMIKNNLIEGVTERPHFVAVWNKSAGNIVSDNITCDKYESNMDSVENAQDDTKIISIET